MVELGPPLSAECAPPMFETAPVVEVASVMVKCVQPAPVAEYGAPASAATAVAYAAPAPVAESVPDPQMLIVEKTIEIPRWHSVEKIVEIPEIWTVQGARTSESLGTAPSHHVVFSEVVEVVELGTLSLLSLRLLCSRRHQWSKWLLSWSSASNLLLWLSTLLQHQQQQQLPMRHLLLLLSLCRFLWCRSCKRQSRSHSGRSSRKAIEIPEIRTIQRTRTSESLRTAPVRQATPAELVEVVELEPPPSAESAPPVFVVEKIQEQIVEAIEAIPQEHFQQCTIAPTMQVVTREQFHNDVEHTPRKKVHFATKDDVQFITASSRRAEIIEIIRDLAQFRNDIAQFERDGFVVPHLHQMYDDLIARNAVFLREQSSSSLPSSPSKKIELSRSPSPSTDTCGAIGSRRQRGSDPYRRQQKRGGPYRCEEAKLSEQLHLRTHRLEIEVCERSALSGL